MQLERVPIPEMPAELKRVIEERRRGSAELEEIGVTDT